MTAHRDHTDDTVFIPPLVLCGSRAAQVRQLEDRLSQLHAIRRRLVNDDVAHVAHAHAGSNDASPRHWFFAGAATALALALLTLGSWVTHDEGPAMGSTIVEVVRATR